MYTHLYVTPEEAKRILAAHANKPDDPAGFVTHENFEKYLAKFSRTYIQVLGVYLEQHRNFDWPPRYQSGTFVLKFDYYLPRLPQPLIDLGTKIVRAEIVRINNATTRALPGYYEDDKLGLVAFVESIVPVERRDGRQRSAQVTAQNIRVSGPTLDRAQAFNTRVSVGDYSRYLVNRF